jgi:2-phosphoglycerate kinase
VNNTGEYTFLKINRETFWVYLDDEENSRRRFIGRRRDSEGGRRGVQGIYSWR